MTKSFSVAVIGDWHLAFVTATVLAECGHQVFLTKPLNLNAETWPQFPTMPVTEPGLPEMIQKNLQAKRLGYENGISEQLVADFVWLAVDTPVNEMDEPQLEPLLVIADQIAKMKKEPKALIVSSQIPLGFCKELESRTGLSVAYVPENLRLGKGIETFMRADRTVIGSNHLPTAESVKELMSSFETEFLLCNAVTAEMIKHANNAFLATSISLANELARVGEKFGVDGVTVGKALKLDKRIGKAAYVIPGLGFAGGTLPRDLRVIQQLGKNDQIPTQLVDAVLQVNENTTHAIFEVIESHIKKYNLPKTALVLGYTYKADTNTLRRSLSLDMASLLREANYKVMGLDPVMNKEDLSLLKGKIDHFDYLEKISESQSIILLMTARNEFAHFDWQKLNRDKNSLVLDCQNFLKADSVLGAGLIFKSLWSPARLPLGADRATH
jgi:UDPglucose 6-dehydrogenase